MKKLHRVVAAVDYSAPARAAFDRALAVSRQHDERRSKYKAAYLISMVAFFVMGLTVHFWGSSFVLFMFLLGAGAWLMDTPASAEPVANHRRNRHAGSGGTPLRQFERMGR